MYFKIPVGLVETFVHLAFLEGGIGLVDNFLGLTGGFFVGGFLVTKDKGIHLDFSDLL